MSRRITGSLLIISLLASFGIVALTSIARAQWTPADNTTTEATPEKPAEAATSNLLPTVESIQALLEAGKPQEAESAYLEWATAWQSDDPDLFAKIETAVLENEYKADDTGAFIAELRAGVPAAMEQFREGKVTLDGADRLAAIRALGAHGGPAEVSFLLTLLRDADPAVVGAAVEALGSAGNTRCLPDLYLCTRTANLENSILIGKTLLKLGAARQLRERYSSQVKYPFNYVSKRACLLLALGGVNANGDFLKATIDAKKDTWADDNPGKLLDANPASFYPLILSVLGNLRGPEVQGYVEAGLKGSEEEQLATLQSLDALSAEKADVTLKSLILAANEEGAENANLTLNDATPAAVRLAAIGSLGSRHTDAAEELLRQLASSVTLADADSVAAAILTAEKNGLLSDESFRMTLRVQLMRDEPAIVRAARTALLAAAIR